MKTTRSSLPSFCVTPSANIIEESLQLDHLNYEIQRREETLAKLITESEMLKNELIGTSKNSKITQMENEIAGLDVKL